MVFIIVGKRLSQDYEETIPSAEINESQSDFHRNETKKDLIKIPKNCHFSKSTNIQFSILEQFLKFKACKSENNDAKGTFV